MKMSQAVQDQIFSDIDGLEQDPRNPQVKKMEGEDNMYRLRSGSYRIVFQIHDDELVVLILRAAHRKDVYDKM